MKALLALVLVVLGSLFVRPAMADEVAPALEAEDLRRDATSALKAARLEARAITGIYVAIDPNPTDAFAQAACDDDGDPVVVVSDAMLRLVARVTQLAEYDRANKTATVDGYAVYLASSQAPGRLLLPPPPGAFGMSTTEPRIDHEHLANALSFVLGRELEHHRMGDLACAHPTATKEAGDAVWTPAEQRAAAVTARTLYPGNASVRDEDAMSRVLAGDANGQDGHAPDGLDVLAFFARFEAEHARKPARVVPSYLLTHPGAATRLAHLKTVAAKKAATP